MAEKKSKISIGTPSPKPHRVSNRELLDRYRLYDCSVNACTVSEVCAHHIKTKGSGGNDEEDNLLSLCQKHHAEVHQIGLCKFSNKYPEIEYKLREKGWVLHGSKWVNFY